MILPTEYSKLSQLRKEQVRMLYAVQQEGKCMHCKQLLSIPPKQTHPINWKLFPKGFMNNPIHLQHNHDTDTTEGVVHAYCNAVLWQYHGR